MSVTYVDGFSSVECSLAIAALVIGVGDPQPGCNEIDAPQFEWIDFIERFRFHIDRRRGVDIRVAVDV